MVNFPIGAYTFNLVKKRHLDLKTGTKFRIVCKMQDVNPKNI